MTDSAPEPSDDLTDEDRQAIADVNLAAAQLALGWDNHSFAWYLTLYAKDLAEGDELEVIFDPALDSETECEGQA